MVHNQGQVKQNENKSVSRGTKVNRATQPRVPTNINVRNVVATTQKKIVQKIHINKQHVHETIHTQQYTIHSFNFHCSLYNDFMLAISNKIKSLSLNIGQMNSLALHILQKYPHEHNNMLLFHENTIKKHSDTYSHKQSTDESVFHYEKWYYNYKNEIPKLENFTVLPCTENGIHTYLQLKDSTNTFYTFMPKQNLITLLQYLTHTRWSLLDRISREAVWSLLGGFHTIYTEIKDTYVEVTDQSCCEYIKEELKFSRFIKISKSPFKHYAACKYFPISEQKDGYTKTRYVCNLVHINSLTQPPGLDISYTFPTPVGWFEDDDLFSILESANYYSIIDKKNFYRQWVSLPSPCSIIQTKNDLYIDLRARQGATWSSSQAQLISNTMDTFFNHENTITHNESFSTQGYTHARYKHFARTIQDDTFLLHNCKSPKIATQSLSSLIYLNTHHFSFELQTKKTKTAEICVKWSGYMWHAKDKCLFIPPTKYKSIFDIANEIMTKPCSRLQYASFLGRVYHYRLIAFGLQLNFGTLLYTLRAHTFPHTHPLSTYLFVSDSIIAAYKEFFNEILPVPSTKACNEINLMLSILQQKVTYKSIRYNINPTSLTQFRFFWPDNFAFSDASKQGLGFIIRLKGKYYCFSHIISKNDQLYLISINAFELFAVLCTLITYIHIHIKQSKSSIDTSSVMMYIDNSTAESISATKRVSLKSETLANISQCLSNITSAFRSTIRVSYSRVDTKSNFFADLASRVAFQTCHTNTRVLGSFSYLLKQFSLSPFLK